MTGSIEWSRARLTLIALCLCVAPAVARAQELPVTETPIEGAIAITINSKDVDANGVPQGWGGFGIDGAIARRVSTHLAIEGDIGIRAYAYEPPDAAPGSRLVSNDVHTYAVGVRLATPFARVPPHSRDRSRFYVHALGGFDNSAAVGTRHVLIVGGGIDGFAHRTPNAIRPAPPVALRMAMDYWLTSGGFRGAQGYRFLFGFVIGPHQ